MRSKLAVGAMAAMMSGVDFIPLQRDPGRQWRPKQPKQPNKSVEAAAQAKRDRKNRLRLERMK